MGRQPWIENAVVIAPRMKLSAPLTRRPATAVHPRATREAKLKIGTSQPRNGCGRTVHSQGEGAPDEAGALTSSARGVDPFARGRAFGSGGIGSRMFQTHVCIGQS
jgi:hypothetical protein